MKKLLMSLVILSIAVFANANDSVLAVAETSEVTASGTRVSTLPTSCTYGAQYIQWANGDEALKIFINSDDEAFINFGFELPKDLALPLREGFAFAPNEDEIITYENGILTYKSKEKDNITSTFHEVAKLTISADLKTISKAYIKEYVTRFRIAKDPEVEMTCTF